MHLMHTMQPRGQQVELAIVKSEALKLFDRREHVIAIGAGPAMALPDVMQLRIEVELARVLRVRAVDDVANCAHPAPGIVLELHRTERLAVHGRDLLAFAQIGDGRVSIAGEHAVCDAATGAAAIEP